MTVSLLSKYGKVFLLIGILIHLCRGYACPDCSHTCPTGFYGINCSRLCPSGCYNRTCDEVTGYCLGCPAGRMGKRCEMLCPQGRYGENCSTNCSSHCAVRICDPVTGKCLKCLQGFYEGDCLIPAQERSNLPVGGRTANRAALVIMESSFILSLLVISAVTLTLGSIVCVVYYLNWNLLFSGPPPRTDVLNRLVSRSSRCQTDFEGNEASSIKEINTISLEQVQRDIPSYNHLDSLNNPFTYNDHIKKPSFELKVENSYAPFNLETRDFIINEKNNDQNFAGNFIPKSRSLQETCERSKSQREGCAGSVLPDIIYTSAIQTPKIHQGNRVKPAVIGLEDTMFEAPPVLKEINTSPKVIRSLNVKPVNDNSGQSSTGSVSSQRTTKENIFPTAKGSEANIVTSCSTQFKNQVSMPFESSTLHEHFNCMAIPISNQLVQSGTNATKQNESMVGVDRRDFIFNSMYKCMPVNKFVEIHPFREDHKTHIIPKYITSDDQPSCKRSFSDEKMTHDTINMPKSHYGLSQISINCNQPLKYSLGKTRQSVSSRSISPNVTRNFFLPGTSLKSNLPFVNVGFPTGEQSPSKVRTLSMTDLGTNVTRTLSPIKNCTKPTIRLSKTPAKSKGTHSVYLGDVKQTVMERGAIGPDATFNENKNVSEIQDACNSRECENHYNIFASATELYSDKAEQLPFIKRTKTSTMNNSIQRSHKVYEKGTQVNFMDKNKPKQQFSKYCQSEVHMGLFPLMPLIENAETIELIEIHRTEPQKVFDAEIKEIPVSPNSISSEMSTSSVSENDLPTSTHDELVDDSPNLTNKENRDSAERKSQEDSLSTSIDHRTTLDRELFVSEERNQLVAGDLKLGVNTVTNSSWISVSDNQDMDSYMLADDSIVEQGREKQQIQRYKCNIVKSLSCSSLLSKKDVNNTIRGVFNREQLTHNPLVSEKLSPKLEKIKNYPTPSLLEKTFDTSTDKKDKSSSDMDKSCASKQDFMDNSLATDSDNIDHTFCVSNLDQMDGSFATNIVKIDKFPATCLDTLGKKPCHANLDKTKTSTNTNRDKVEKSYDNLDEINKSGDTNQGGMKSSSYIKHDKFECCDIILDTSSTPGSSTDKSCKADISDEEEKSLAINFARSGIPRKADTDGVETFLDTSTSDLELCHLISVVKERPNEPLKGKPLDLSFIDTFKVRQTFDGIDEETQPSRSLTTSEAIKVTSVTQSKTILTENEGQLPSDTLTNSCLVEGKCLNLENATEGIEDDYSLSNETTEYVSMCLYDNRSKTKLDHKVCHRIDIKPVQDNNMSDTKNRDCVPCTNVPRTKNKCNVHPVRPCAKMSCYNKSASIVKNEMTPTEHITTPSYRSSLTLDYTAVIDGNPVSAKGVSRECKVMIVGKNKEDGSTENAKISFNKHEKVYNCLAHADKDSFHGRALETKSFRQTHYARGQRNSKSLYLMASMDGHLKKSLTMEEKGNQLGNHHEMQALNISSKLKTEGPNLSKLDCRKMSNEADLFSNKRNSNKLLQEDTLGQQSILCRIENRQSGEEILPSPAANRKISKSSEIYKDVYQTATESFSEKDTGSVDSVYQHIDNIPIDAFNVESECESEWRLCISVPSNTAILRPSRGVNDLEQSNKMVILHAPSITDKQQHNKLSRESKKLDYSRQVKCIKLSRPVPHSPNKTHDNDTNKRLAKHNQILFKTKSSPGGLLGKSPPESAASRNSHSTKLRNSATKQVANIRKSHHKRKLSTVLNVGKQKDKTISKQHSSPRETGGTYENKCQHLFEDIDENGDVAKFASAIELDE